MIYINLDYVDFVPQFSLIKISFNFFAPFSQGFAFPEQKVERKNLD